MKRTVSKESTFCDACGKESGHWKCLECGRDYCYECGKTETKGYPHGVHFSGTGDGRYCHACYGKLRASGDPLHAAYRLIESLRHEEAGWYAEFKRRCEAAEATVKRLYDERYPR